MSAYYRNVHTKEGKIVLFQDDENNFFIETKKIEKQLTPISKDEADYILSQDAMLAKYNRFKLSLSLKQIAMFTIIDLMPSLNRNGEKQIDFIAYRLDFIPDSFDIKKAKANGVIISSDGLRPYIRMSISDDLAIYLANRYSLCTSPDHESVEEMNVREFLSS